MGLLKNHRIDLTDNKNWLLIWILWREKASIWFALTDFRRCGEYRPHVRYQLKQRSWFLHNTPEETEPANNNGAGRHTTKLCNWQACMKFGKCFACACEYESQQGHSNSHFQTTLVICFSALFKDSMSLNRPVSTNLVLWNLSSSFCLSRTFTQADEIHSPP